MTAAKQRELDALEGAIERLTWESQHPNKPGHHWLKMTVSRLGADGKQHAVSEWIEVQDDFVMAPANRPVIEQTHTPRTTTRPGDDQWKVMDRRNWKRVGALWYTCDHCTSYELVEIKQTKDEDGDVVYREQRRTPPPMQTRGGEAPRPVTGMNLYRNLLTGEVICWDCGAHKATRPKEPPKERGMRNGAGHTHQHRTHQPIDRKAILAQWVAEGRSI